VQKSRQTHRCTVNFIQVVIINYEETDIHSFVGYHQGQNCVVVAWCDTIDVRNWIEDFGYDEAPCSRCKDCEMYVGFFAASESVVAKTEKEVNALLNKYPNSTTSVTGQNLGAALSTFGAIELQLKLSKVAELYNFGNPRIGNDKTATFINSKLRTRRRVIHNRDNVLHLPFKVMDFTNTAHEMLYDETMKTYKVCDASGENGSCPNRIDVDYSSPDYDIYWIQMDVNIY
jgi:hypothetical protein